jgi:hypothetical protein
MRIRSRGGAHRASILLAAVALLAACGANDSGSGETPDTTPSSASPAMSATTPGAVAPAPPRTKPWVDLQVGECVAAVPAVDVGEATVTVVDCSGPHQAEVYLLAPVAVNAAVAGVAGQACAAGVDPYTGDTPEPALSVTYLIDSNQDRTGAVPLPSTVICLLQAADGSALMQTVRD